MCRILAPLASRILLVPVHSERTAEPHGLAEACRAANPSATVIEYPSLTTALSSTARDPFVTIAASLYLIGEAMELAGPVRRHRQKTSENQRMAAATIMKVTYLMVMT